MKLIVAVDQNWAIGYRGGLLAHLSADLRRFKDITMGHPVLLGRKTLATFPGGRPLPGRENFILSTDPDFRVEGATVLRSAEEARMRCPEDTFVIGGEQIYRTLLEDCETAYVTRIDAAFPADAWFPELDVLSGWWVTEEEGPFTENGLTFRYLTYERER